MEYAAGKLAALGIQRDLECDVNAGGGTIYRYGDENDITRWRLLKRRNFFNKEGDIKGHRKGGLINE